MCSCGCWLSSGLVLLVIWFGFEAMMGREYLLELFSPIFASDGRMGIVSLWVLWIPIESDFNGYIFD